MKKYVLCAVCAALASSIFLSGCSLEKIINPTSDETSMFYDTVTSITNDDVKSRKYIDLFLDETLTQEITKDFVKKHETRALDSEEPLALSYFPECTADDQLGLWIKSCKIQYLFAESRATGSPVIGASGYKLTSKNNRCTYNDYLYIMRALTNKYGECTTELYKNGNNVISISEVQQDMSEEQIIEYFNKLFDDGELSVVAKWVDKAHKTIVDFSSPTLCSVEYILD